MQITEIVTEKKGRLLVRTDEVGTFPVYRKEAAAYHIEEGAELTQEQWNQLCTEVLKKRVIKRAMYLLQKMNRTEEGLRQKLRESHYPEELIDEAVDYVKSFHYIDDFRYASAYIRYHQSEKSRLQLKMTLQKRGISPDVIEQALEEEYEDHEDQLIQDLLAKKNYDSEHMDRKEKYRIYQYLLRRGFSGSAVKRQMEL